MGIYSEVVLVLSRATISENEAHGGPGGAGEFDRNDLNGEGFGGGIFNGGILDLVEGSVSDNRATGGQNDRVDGGDGIGGGIYNATSGTLRLTRSTLSGNHASGSSGGLGGDGGDGLGGGVYNAGLLIPTNSTLSGNRANRGLGSSGGANGASLGGGLYNYREEVDLTHTTITANRADRGGGIYNVFGTVQLINTLVGDQGLGQDCAGSPVTSSGHNLDSDRSCRLRASGDLTAAPRLDVLRDNGGPTKTHALLSYSPAIDSAGDRLCPTTDQRGAPRPVDGDADGTAYCDIGAYELGATLYMLYLPIVLR